MGQVEGDSIWSSAGEATAPIPVVWRTPQVEAVAEDDCGNDTAERRHLASLVRKLGVSRKKQDLSSFWDAALGGVQTLVRGAESGGVNSSQARRYLDLFLREGARFLPEVRAAVPDEMLAPSPSDLSCAQAVERWATTLGPDAAPPSEPLARSVTVDFPMSAEDWLRIIKAPYG